MVKKATFAERLKEALALRGMTKADLSRITGMSKSTFTHYEKGDWEAKQDAVYRIARALNLPEAWLMGFGSSIEEFQAAEEKQPPATEGLSEKDQRLVNWFRSLPPEKQEAILILQGGPKDAL